MTLRAPINIALIKYWGKLHEGYNIPLNSSFSVTLDRNSFYSETTARLEEGGFDSFELRDQSGSLLEIELPKSFDKLKAYFLAVSRRRLGVEQFSVNLKSVNSFPTKAGLASSASGLSCIALCLCRLFNYFEESEAELQEDVFENIKGWFLNDDSGKIEKVLAIVLLLRIISGSSCRSVYLFGVLQIGPDLLADAGDNPKMIDDAPTGLVNRMLETNRGVLELSHWRYEKTLERAGLEFAKYYNGPVTWKNSPEALYHRFTYPFPVPKDWASLSNRCVAFPLTHLGHAPRQSLVAFFARLRMYVCLLHKEKKKVGSTEGMVLSALTSENMVKRVDIVRSNLLAFLKSIQTDDVEGFLKVIMRDSNNLHSVCMDTYPPLFYLSERSRDAVGFIHQFNAKQQRTVAGYTFDAGPNPFIIVDKTIEAEFIGGFKESLEIANKDLIAVDMLV